MKLLLIRHAQSANNAAPEEQRVEDPSITELGHQQASALAEWMEKTVELHHLVTSPFRRSLETTAHLQRTLGLTPQVWVDLHEQGGCYSGYEPANYCGRPGMNRAQIHEQFPGCLIEPAIDENGWWRCQPYESDRRASQRARRLMLRACQEFADTDGCVGFVMHADFKRLFLNELFSASPTESNGWHGIYNTAVTVVEFRAGAFQLRTFNSTSHLQSGLLSR